MSGDSCRRGSTLHVCIWFGVHSSRGTLILLVLVVINWSMLIMSMARYTYTSSTSLVLDIPVLCLPSTEYLVQDIRLRHWYQPHQWEHWDSGDSSLQPITNHSNHTKPIADPPRRPKKKISVAALAARGHHTGDKYLPPPSYPNRPSSPPPLSSLFHLSSRGPTPLLFSVFFFSA